MIYLSWSDPLSVWDVRVSDKGGLVFKNKNHPDVVHFFRYSEVKAIFSWEGVFYKLPGYKDCSGYAQGQLRHALKKYLEDYEPLPEKSGWHRKRPK